MRRSRSLPSSLRVAAEASFAPVGPGYDPREVLRRPLRPLRGGPDALVARLGWRASRVTVRVLAAGACTAEDVEAAMGAARGLAAVDDDPTEFLALARRHALVAELAGRYDARLPRTPTLFESFVVSVLEQLVTTWEAWQAARRLWSVAGEAVPGTELFAAPTPAGLRAVPMWRMHALGVGSRRAVTLREGARRGAALERLRELPPELVVEKLQSLPGVGPWTANLVTLRALGWADAVPVGDLHAPRVVTQALTGAAGDDAAMLEALEPFRPHRARVVTLLRAAEFARGGETGVPRRRLPRVDKHRREPSRY